MTQIHYRKKEEKKVEQNSSNLQLFPSMNVFNEVEITPHKKICAFLFQML